MRRMNENGGDGLLLIALGALAIGTVSYFAALPFQIFVILYGLMRLDVRYLPAIYIALINGYAFSFSGIQPIRLVFLIPLSALNIFTIACFFITIVNIVRRQFDKSALVFALVWFLSIIPVVVIALNDRADGVESWSESFVKFMVPSFYFWGILVGRSWEHGRDYFIKRFSVIFFCQVALELLDIYNIGCQFQDSIIPVCLGIAIFGMRFSFFWKGIALGEIILGMALMFFAGYLSKLRATGFAEETAMVSTFTRLFVVVIGVFIALTVGKSLHGHALKSFPWICLILCVAIFSYAVMRADYKNVGDATVELSNVQTLAERFEGKLIGDRGALWLQALKTEVFRKPLIFRRTSDLLVYNPNLKSYDLKVPPHNQVLTLLSRQGWWFGLTMVIFLWWMHLRSFKAAETIDYDRTVLVVLLAPSVAIFVAVGLTGQHVFNQLWTATSMASLTFPGLIYGVAQERAMGDRI